MRVPDLTPGREDRGRLLCVCVMWAVARKNYNLSVLRVPSRHVLRVDFGVMENCVIYKLCCYDSRGGGLIGS